MPIVPSDPLPDQSSPVTKLRTMSEDTWTDPDIYVNVKVSKYLLNYGHYFQLLKYILAY